MSGWLAVAALTMNLLVFASCVYIGLTAPEPGGIRIDLLLAPIAGLVAFIALVGGVLRAARHCPSFVALSVGLVALGLSALLWYDWVGIHEAVVSAAQHFGWEPRDCGGRRVAFRWGEYCDQY